MSTQLQPLLSMAAGEPRRYPMRKLADTALKSAAGFWFIVTVLGELIFAVEVASFYGLTAMRGQWMRWNQTMTHGYVPGQPIGNMVVVIHLAAAALILVSGALQLIPFIQRRAPRLHRWNGRLYMLTAFAVSLAGLYMMWFRGTVGGIWQHIGQSIDAALIMVFAVLALRTALSRDFKTHRRWALRLFLAVSASLFIRASVFLAFTVNGGPFGFDPVTLQGPFLTFVTFAQYLVPLGVLELYLRAQQYGGVRSRFAMATVLFLLTIGLGAGTAMVTVASFVPAIRKAYDTRPSIAETLQATITSSGIDQAVRQYNAIKAKPGNYNLDENELNLLGYDLLKKKQFASAIRIFQLNVETYPKSGNTWDSLAEGYMDNGNRALAIADYHKSLELNPKNTNAVTMLGKLNAR